MGTYISWNPCGKANTQLFNLVQSLEYPAFFDISELIQHKLLV